MNSHLPRFGLFVLFEFRSFRSFRTIAGPGDVTGPLPRPKQRWAKHREQSSQKDRGWPPPGSSDSITHLPGGRCPECLVRWGWGGRICFVFYHSTSQRPNKNKIHHVVFCRSRDKQVASSEGCRSQHMKNWSTSGANSGFTSRVSLVAPSV